MSPLAQNPPTTSPSVASFTAAAKGHSRKNSSNAGLFDSTLPSTSTSNLSQVGSMAQPSPTLRPSGRRELSASQIAAQAAIMHHRNQQQSQQQPQTQGQQQYQPQPQHAPHLQHNRQRSQTVPAPGMEYENTLASNKRGSGGPLSPPLLSLTEASAPRESGFGNQGYHNGLLGSHTAAATAAANVVFPRSGQSSPKLPSQGQPHAPPPLVTTTSEKPLKSEKSKVKLFSRPGKIGIKGGDPKDKPLPSPGRSIGHALSSLQRGNFSTTSLDSSSQSFYSLANSSTATIKASEAQPVEKEGKEKKHHFLSRQKHKLKDKEDYHLPLSSASSNSRPTDPSAPSSLYNFNLPPSPGPNSGFKMSGLGHGGRGRDKKKEDKFDDAASSFTPSVEFPGPGSFPQGHGFGSEPLDGSKYGLNNMTADDAWPFLKAKVLVVFEGEDVRIPIEDMNQVVRLHIQYCIARRSPNIIVEDLRDLLHTGFSSIDHNLHNTPEDRLIPALVEIWVYTFDKILHYMMGVFLPLDMEFLGVGTLLSPEQARDFWGGVVSATTLAEKPRSSTTGGYGSRAQPPPPPVAPISTVLDIRRIVLIAFRDCVILPRYDVLKSMMSRSALEFLPQSLASMAMSSPVPVPSPGPHSTFGPSFNQPLSTSPSGDSIHSFRPGTAQSFDPATASYNSTSTTLLPESSAGSIASRSRAISNVSFGSSSDAPSSTTRPFTPSSLNALGGGGGGGSAQPGTSTREQNVEDSKQVAQMVARMLQCLSILAGAGHQGGVQPDEGHAKVEELNKLLKLNWLGRGRTGRNRRGIVGGRVRRGTAEGIREE